MEDNRLIKYKNNIVKRVGDIVTLTNKLINTSEILIPYKNKDKWGFCTPDKKIVIDCIYDEVSFFDNNGLSRVRVDNHLGYINTSGKVVIPIIHNYRFLDYFYSGFARVRMPTETPMKFNWGYYNICGEIILKTNHLVGHFDDRVTCYSENFRWGLMDCQGIKITESNYRTDILIRLSRKKNLFYDNLICLKEEQGKSVYLNRSGCIKLELPINLNGSNFFNELARVYNRSNNKSGFINKQGIIVIPTKYDAVSDFSEGLAAVNLDAKWGFINTDGDIVVDCVYYESKKVFSEGLAAVRHGGKWGFINSEGSVVIDFIYEDVGFFSNGLCGVRINNAWGYIDKTGQIVIEPKYRFGYPFKNNYARVKDFNGDYILDIVDSGFLPDDFDEDLIMKSNANWVAIDKNGTEFRKI